ncbi:5'-3' exonuclease [Actinoplanes sp. CA-030573]|uniref:5'-3' exonuclease n=1 Tax=Actinoplanes sp. CA-030573 TaxID=3239898 RepID=UPI003D8D4F23
MTPLLLVDGHHLLYRAWFGFPARIHSRDRSRDLTGVFGFLALLRKTHREAVPDAEIIVVFDGENGAAARRRLDPSYKATRMNADHMPLASLAPIKEALSDLRITWVEIDDSEGDDVIAALATIAAARGRTVICLSGDRDLHQLAAPTITILTPERRQITPATLVARYRVTPAQWPDYRAMTGDPADNIAGIRGIGPHTAATLLAGGLHLEDLPSSDRLHGVRGAAINRAWLQLLIWRDMIRLNRTVPISPGLITDETTPPMPRAASILESLKLW